MKKRVKLNTYDRPNRPKFETNEERIAYIESVTPPKPLIRIGKDEEGFGRSEISLDGGKTREPKVK